MSSLVLQSLSLHTVDHICVRQSGAAHNFPFSALVWFVLTTNPIVAATVMCLQACCPLHDRTRCYCCCVYHCNRRLTMFQCATACSSWMKANKLLRYSSNYAQAPVSQRQMCATTHSPTRQHSTQQSLRTRCISCTCTYLTARVCVCTQLFACSWCCLCLQ